MKSYIANIVTLLLALVYSELNAQKYFVSFTDKANNEFTLSAPEEFLSTKAIERRTKYNIALSEEDLPVSTFYLDSLKKMGVHILWPSKWLNGAIIETYNTTLIDTIDRVSFISKAQLIWKSTSGKTIQKFPDQPINTFLKSATETYGLALDQTQTVNGHLLHQEGYQGEGMYIAVIDNGFGNVNTLSSFTHLWSNNQITGAIDFVEPGSDIYNSYYTHGTAVLSIMAGFIENEYKGTAPDAKYLLLRSEDNRSEYPIEEYNWVIAAEYADSAGVDVINSSLGYYEFDDASFNYSYSDMDGQSTTCVKGAEIAFSKGMLVVCSAGNEGVLDWKYIITPSDGEHVIAVGAIQPDSIVANFSSYGPSSDGRVKPDVCAMGYLNAIQSKSDLITRGNGTSFSSPVAAGLAACLWQTNQNLSNQEVLNLIRQSGNKYTSPDNRFGYGIPDFFAAANLDNAIHTNDKDNLQVFPNPFSSQLHITKLATPLGKAVLTIYDVTGNVVSRKNTNGQQKITFDGLNDLPHGIYILEIIESSGKYTYKLFKE